MARKLGKKYYLTVRPVVWEFFAAAQKGDWTTTSNLFNSIEAGSHRYGSAPWVPQEIWGTIHDTYGAYEQFHSWNLELLKRFGKEVIETIPSGSIYFGGTDAGRFVISALSTSHSEGRPFFTLTQNALADSTYLGYLRDMYGEKIHIPTAEEYQKLFEDHLKDAQTRAETKQLKEGEDYSTVGGRVTLQGLVAVMLVNERLVRFIMEKNPDRKFYVEESFALESLYPHSIPHGLILQVSHEPLDHLPKAAIETDHKFWTKQIRSLVGKAVGENTSVSQLCAWTETVYVRSNYADFTGNRAFTEDKQAPQYFSKCRSAIASLYQWRSKQPQENAASAMLLNEADFAHRQAVALSPYNPEAVWRYIEYLLDQKRTNDAKVLIQTTLEIGPSNRMELDSSYLQSSMEKLRKKARQLGIEEPR